jgi:hypothetical protein
VDLLLALQRNKAVREVRLSPRAREALAFTLDAQAARLLHSDTEQHAYEPGFTPEQDGVLVLEYELPETIARCKQTLPNDVTPVTEALLAAEPPIGLVAVETGRAARFLFQAVDSRNLLRQGRALFFHPRGFDSDDRVGLVIADRVDAIHKGGKLYFRSEHTVRRFLDMERYFKGATDEDLKKFFGSKTFDVGDWDGLKKAAGDVVRRKLHALLASDGKLDPSRIRAVAHRVGMSLEVRDGRLVVPTTRKELHDFVRVVHDDFLESMVEGSRVYLTTSKKRVGKPKAPARKP